MNTAVIGHKKIIEFFEAAARSGRLSHAYCLVGPDQVGRRKVAEAVAAELLGVSPTGLHLSLDYWPVDRIADEKTEKLKKDISLEQIKELVSFLTQSAFQKNGYRVAIINDAENLNQSGANALLKSLEELNEKTVIFLLVGNVDAVLPTILSRAQPIFFAPVSEEAIFEYLKNDGLDESQAGELARLSRGLPGRAIRWRKEPDILERRLNEAKRFESLFRQPFYHKLQAVDGLFGDKTDHIKARGELAEVLDLWQEMIVARLKAGMSGENVPAGNLTENAHASPATLIAVERKITEAKAGLSANIHPRLLVEEILLQIP